METVLRVASFNLKSSLFGMGIHKWKRRRELVIKMFRELKADITGVQELTPLMRRDLENELSDYNLVGRGRGGRLLDEHSDIAVRNGLKVTYDDTFWLSKDPSRFHRIFSILYPLAWIFPRICTVAEVNLGDRRIRVFNTHLEVSSETARFLQLRLICCQISRWQEKDPLPTILMGDFNTDPNSRSIHALIDNGFDHPNVRLKSVAEGIKGGTFHFFKGGMGKRRIDYIFASEEFHTLSTEIIRRSYDNEYPSDHYPIIATLALSEAGGTTVSAR